MIGVFDSGFGGLTVLKALCKILPKNDFLYFGDTANTPYGTRSEGEVLDLTMSACRYLFGQGCGLVILACNTASAIALRPMQEYFVPADRRVLGVLVPVIEEIAGRPYRGAAPVVGAPCDVVFFATPATVRSGAFARELALRRHGPRVVSVACDALVDALQAGQPTDALVAGYVAEALRRCRAPDVAVLGCTHYPLVQQTFRAYLPEGTRMISQPEAAAARLRSYLERYPQFGGGSGRVRLVTSGDPAVVSRRAEQLLGEPHRFAAM